MPSDKAQANKALVATCVGCEKTVSTELMITLPGRVDGSPQQFPVCIKCANGGWRPPGFTGVYTHRPL